MWWKQTSWTPVIHSEPTCNRTVLSWLKRLIAFSTRFQPPSTSCIHVPMAALCYHDLPPALLPCSDTLRVPIPPMAATISKKNCCNSPWSRVSALNYSNVSFCLLLWNFARFHFFPVSSTSFSWFALWWAIMPCTMPAPSCFTWEFS